MTVLDVDLVVNCYERTYQKVLSHGFVTALEKQANFKFAKKTILINNVTDRNRAAILAHSLQSSGEISNWFFVADELPHALEVVGLTEKDLGRTIHYSDCALVAVTLNGSPYICYWDAEVVLGQHNDWISESLALLEQRPDVLVANPQWDRELEALSHTKKPWIRRRWQPLETVGNFNLCYGFSDQLFLVKRADLAKPIYKEAHIASIRYPMSQISPIFEQRVDSYMRNHGLLRAVVKTTSYSHLGDDGVSHPSMTIRERIRDTLWRKILLRVAALVFATSKKFNCT